MRTENEIQRMIRRLEEVRSNLPEYSVFGDPNWKVIDVQTEILEWVLGEREDDDII